MSSEDKAREREREAQEDGLTIEFPWDESAIPHSCPACGGECRCCTATHKDSSGTARDCQHRCDG